MMGFYRFLSEFWEYWAFYQPLVKAPYFWMCVRSEEKGFENCLLRFPEVTID